MNRFPRTQDVLDIIDNTARLEVYNPNFVNELGVELRELLKRIPIPQYREYKGVIFDEDFWVFDDWHYDSVAHLISQNAETFSDDDFIPLMDLKNNPYKDVTHNVFEHITDEQLNNEYFTRFSDLLAGCSSKRLIAELESRGIHNQWKYTGHEVPHSYDG